MNIHSRFMRIALKLIALIKNSQPMNEEYEIEMSPLCQEISSAGKTVQVDIYRGNESEWTLEVVDEYNNSTVWNDLFKTDSAALTEVKKTILSEGINALIGPKEEKNDA